MDTPFVYDTGVSLWRPKNFSGKFEGPVSVRYALTRSMPGSYIGLNETTAG